MIEAMDETASSVGTTEKRAPILSTPVGNWPPYGARGF